MTQDLELERINKNLMYVMEGSPNREYHSSSYEQDQLAKQYVSNIDTLNTIPEAQEEQTIIDIAKKLEKKPSLQSKKKK